MARNFIERENLLRVLSCRTESKNTRKQFPAETDPAQVQQRSEQRATKSTLNLGNTFILARKQVSVKEEHGSIYSTHISK